MTIEIYETLGWELEKEGSQLIGLCPFCQKEKMYVDPKKTTYHCKVCDERGNSISVLGHMFDQVYKGDLRKASIKQMSTRRGLPTEAFKLDPSLGWDKSRKEPVWCIRTPEGVSVTLRHGVYRSNKYQIRNMKGTSLGLLGADQLTDNDHPVYLVEGEWDRIAMIYLLHKMGQEGVVIAVPGAGNFKKEWSPWFKGRRVVVCYDNDEPGQKGSRRVALFVKHSCRSLHFLRWDEDEEEGYDTHDLILENMASLKTAWKYISDNQYTSLLTSDGGEEEIGDDHDALQREQESLEPITHLELHDVFNKWLKQDNCDLIDITMGCLWASYLPGDPLWILIVAPPSGSKTESLTPCSAWHPVHPVSTVTAKALMSGFAGQGGEDPSLFAEIDGKQAALIIKDMTPLLEGNDNDRDEVFGLLRDAYDGQTKKLFGNGVRREYNNLNFSLIAGVTPAIDTYGGAAMGERFLKFRSDKELARHDDRDRAFKAIANSDISEKMRAELQDACLRSLARKFDSDKVPQASEQTTKFHTFIVDMAEFCAKARAVAPFDRYSGVQAMAPVQEALPRLAKQFIKMAQGLALHYGLDTLDDIRIRRLIKRISIHTSDSLTVKVIRALSNVESPIGLRALHKRTREVSLETMRDIVIKLERTKICTKTQDVEGNSQYILQEQMIRIIKESKLFSKLPRNDPFYQGPQLRIGKQKTSSGTGSTKDTASIKRKKKVKLVRGRKTKS